MSDDQIEEVKKRVDIVSLVAEHITLKKAGRNYKALCPFHSEKTPSFMVSPELQIFKCFGCSEGGDCFAFLQKYEGMDFAEALRFLADRVGIRLKPISGQRSQKDILYEINLFAAKLYHYILLKHSLGKKALSYFTDQRKIRPEAIKTFLLGFAPEDPDLLYKFLVQKKNFSPKDIEAAGLFVRTSRGIVDRFRGRAIFPLFDHRGNAIGLAGRILPEIEKRLSRSGGVGKYVNSPETPVYHKSSVLYGLNLTRSEIKKQKKAVVVEGELDLISSWQVGVKNAVAIKGTALTEDQVSLLSRITSELILALDRDVAGDVAARRGISIATNAGLNVKVTTLGKYKDPDDFARSDPEGYKKVLDKTQGVWDYIIDSVVSKVDLDKGEEKAKVSRELSPILASIEDRIVQAHYVGLVARRLKVPAEAVAQEVDRVKSKQASSASTISALQKPKEKGRAELLEERLASLIFQSDPKVFLKKKYFDLIATPLLKRIVVTLKLYLKQRGKKKFSDQNFYKVLPGELRVGFSELVMQDVNLDQGKVDIQKEIKLVEQELLILKTKKRLDELAGQISEYEKSKKKKKLEIAKKEFANLTETFTRLSS